MDIRSFFQRKESKSVSVTKSGTQTEKHTDDQTTDLLIQVPREEISRSSSTANLEIHDLGNTDSGPIQPNLDSYPKTKHGNQNRAFSKIYYTEFKWLEYSIQSDRVFCFCCRNFGIKGPMYDGEAFTVTGFNNWKKFGEKGKKHNSSKFHIENFCKWNEYEKSKKTGTVHTKLSSAYYEQVNKNREYIKILADIVLCLCRQGLAFRGHDETISSENRGNFLEICSLLAKYNPTFHEYYAKPINYTSHKIQDDLIDIISNLVRKKIIEEIKQCGIVGIMCDEARCFKEEQLSLCVRYVKDLEIRERFLRFIECSQERTAESLFNLIVHNLNDLKLDGVEVIAQSYDGAAVMSGQVAGLQTKIREKYPAAIYTHCMSHRLNLVVTDVCNNIQGARNFFNVMQSLYVHFSRPSTHKTLKKIQEYMKMTPKELGQMSDTRWACRYKTCDAVKTSYNAILEALDLEINEDRDRNSVEAIGLLASLRQPSFIVYLFAMEEILRIIHILSMKLQEKDATVGNSISIINGVIKTFEDMRSDESFMTRWQVLETFSDQFDITLEPPRTTSKRKKKESSDLRGYIVTSTIGASEEYVTDLPKIQYWRIHVWFKILDAVINDLKSRFSPLNQEIGISCDKFLNLDFEGGETFIKLYANTVKIDKTSLKSEMTVAKNLIKLNSDAITIKDLKCLKQNTFPNLYKLLQCALVIPVSSATCERSFSAMRRIKTWLRTSMLQNRFDNVSIICIEKDIKVNPEEVLEEFAKKDRRLSL